MEQLASGELERHVLLELERRVATADARCYQRARLAEKQREARQRTEQHFAVRHQPELLDEVNAREEAIARARALVGAD